MKAGKLVIFCAPSGSGKTTIVQHLLKSYPNLGFSISACTRDKRPNETHGKDYYFLTPDEFKDKLAQNAFAEWEEVYAGNYYGTLKEEIQRLWDQGKDVIFDVDVKGGLRLKEVYGEKALAIFVKVPSFDDLERRLRARNTESEESLQKRLDKVKYESTFENHFDAIVLNDQLDNAIDSAKLLLNKFLER